MAMLLLRDADSTTGLSEYLRDGVRTAAAKTGRAGDVFVKPAIPKAVLLRIKARYERKSPTTKPQR